MRGASKYLFVFVIASSFVIPMFVVNAGGCPGAGGVPPYINGCPTNVNISTKITNPLNTKIDSIPALIAMILNIVLVIGVPIVALAIIYTGFLFVSARGNSEKITDAKKALGYTLIGAALLLGSWVIANAIGTTIADIASTSK